MKTIICDRGKRGDAEFRIHLESLRIPDKVPLTLNLTSEVICEVTAYVKNGILYAYGDIPESVHGFPAIVTRNQHERRKGIITNSRLISISICSAPNVDPGIDAI